MNEKKEVYAVFSGQYSDWICHGYFYNQSDAEKYCAIKNSSSNDRYDYNSNYYTMHLRNLTDDVKIDGKFMYKYSYNIEITGKNKYEVFPNYRNKELINVTDDTDIRDRLILDTTITPQYVEYYTDKDDDDLALKNVTDKFMQRIYEFDLSDTDTKIESVIIRDLNGEIYSKYPDGDCDKFKVFTEILEYCIEKYNIEIFIYI